MRRLRLSLIVPVLIAILSASYPQAADSQRRRPHQRRKPHQAARVAPVSQEFGWSQLAGRPTIAPGRGVAFFIFREGNVVTILTTNLGNQGRRFDAAIELDGGTLTDPRPLRLERRHRDLFRQPAPNRLATHFRTFGATDGVQFAVNGGTQLRIRLDLGGMRPEGSVFLGGQPVAAWGNPVLIAMGA